MIWLWRRACIAAIPNLLPRDAHVVDLMAGTGEVLPHLLKRFPGINKITAIEISAGMHAEAVERLHQGREKRITHLNANALETDLPEGIADCVISTFGLKTFNKDQQAVLARQVARLLKPGGTFSLIEAGDPVRWRLRPLYRFYMTRCLPAVELLFLKGAQDFSMIGQYTAQFVDCAHFAECLHKEGLLVTQTAYVFGCASGVAGHKPAG